MLLALAGLTVVGLLSSSSEGLMSWWREGVMRGFGWGSFLVPVVLVVVAALVAGQALTPLTRFRAANGLGLGLLLIAIFGFLHLYSPDPRQMADQGQGGGYLGYGIRFLIDSSVASVGGSLILLAFGIVGTILTFELSLSQIGRALGGLLAGLRRPAREWPDEPAVLINEPEGMMRAGQARKPPKPKGKPAVAALPDLDDEPEEQLFDRQFEEDWEEEERTAIPKKAERPRHREWALPPLDILQVMTEMEISHTDLRQKAKVIEEALANFHVEAKVREINTGPSVTQFALEPAPGVKVNRITVLSNDLALALAARSIRIEAPVPGQSRVGIEVPNSSISMVGLRDVMESNAFQRGKSKLKIALGRDTAGQAVVADLAKMPHLLIAGATGSGKSVCINAIISCYLFQATPEEIKFLMIDPKMVELSIFKDIPHLLGPVVTDIQGAVGVLRWATREMDRRYKIFAERYFRNIDSYNVAAAKHGFEPLPFIVLIIDELADLMMSSPEDVETAICRLAQMARATGIHIIIATQRPSVDVVTGLIKANFPSRISFAVTSQIDSRVILDTPGAEKLLGRGDMLYTASDAAKPARIQGTFVSDEEIERMVRHWKGQVRTVDYDPELLSACLAPANGDDQEDKLLPEAIELARQHQYVSTSMLQRRLRVGYNRAARLMEILEERGIVGPSDKGRSRQVLAAEVDEDILDE